MSGIGHNRGPALASGWTGYAWRRARADLLPRLPIEVLRGRIRRAGELGIDYTTYASVRAATGRDVVALLFSSNALRVVRGREDPAPAIAARLRSTDARRLLAALAPLDPDAVPFPFDARGPAPTLRDTPRAEAARLAAIAAGLPHDAVLVIGETMMERGWVASGRFAGWLPADRWRAGPGGAPDAA